jgi:hypothetical protein
MNKIFKNKQNLITLCVLILVAFYANYYQSGLFIGLYVDYQMELPRKIKPVASGGIEVTVL